MDERSKLLDEERDVRPRSYTRRWFMLGLFILMTFCSLAAWVSFTNITTLVAQYYKVALGTVVWLNLLYPTLEIPGLLVAVYLIQTKGLRFVLVTAATLQLIGGWLRYLGSAPDRLWALFLGQAFFGLAVPAIDASPTYLANIWFREDQRATAVSIYVVGVSLSVASSSVLIPTFVTNFYYLQIMILIIAGIVSCSTVLNWFIQQDKPPTPPSVSAQAERLSFKESITQIWKIFPFLNLAFFWGMAFGAYQAFLAMATPLTQPQYKPEETGLFTAAVMIAGLVGTITSGVIIDKYKSYKLILLLGASGFSATVLAQSLLMAPGRFGLLLGIFCIQGFFGFMIYPCALEMGADLTFPIPEQYSASILTLSNDAWTVGITYLAQKIYEKYGMRATWWTLTAFVILATIGMAFVKTQYRRLEFERTTKASKIQEASPLGTA